MFCISFSNGDELRIPIVDCFNFLNKDLNLEERDFSDNAFYLDENGEISSSFYYKNDYYNEFNNPALLKQEKAFIIGETIYRLHPDYKVEAWGIFLDDPTLEFDNPFFKMNYVFDEIQAILLSLDFNLINYKELTVDQLKAVNILLENRQNFLFNYYEGSLLFEKKFQQKLKVFGPFPVTDKDIITIIKALINECKDNLNNEFNWDINDLINRAKYSGLMFAIINFIDEFKLKVSKHKSLLIIDHINSNNQTTREVNSLIDIWEKDAGKVTKLGFNKVIDKMVELEYVIYDSNNKLTWVKKSGNKKDDIMRSFLRACVNNNWLDNTLWNHVKSGKDLMRIVNNTFNSTFKYDRKFRSGEFLDLHCVDDKEMEEILEFLPRNR